MPTHLAFSARLAPAAVLALTLVSAPASAQRGSWGPRYKTLPEPQANLASIPPGVVVPRQLQRMAGQRPVIVLTGYWPPSNEAIRRFSTDPLQNPQGWIGQDWEGRGYDVHAFFPEFSPSNCTGCGTGSGTLEVDYQDTSADFWPIVDGLDPVAVLTLSRGYIDSSWELEMNQLNRDWWVPDYVAPTQPTPAPPDPGWPAKKVRLSTQPVQAIVSAVDAAQIGVDAYISFSGDGGAFLSEFIAYHGVWYQALHADPLSPDWCIAGGHVHVGGLLPWRTAEEAAKVSLRELIEYLDEVLYFPCETPRVYCTPKPSSGGCVPSIAPLGWPSLSAGSFQVRASELPANVVGMVAWSSAPDSRPFQGGTLCLASPITRTTAKSTGGLPALGPCGGSLGFFFGPGYQQQAGFVVGQSVYAQVWARDDGDPYGSCLSDALAFTWCP
jgi:hypothetical protein